MDIETMPSEPKLTFPKFLPIGLISHRTNIIWDLYMTPLCVTIKPIQ